VVARPGPDLSVPQSLGAVLARFGGTIADLLFPPRCVSCQSLGAWFCPHCIEQIEAILPPICQRCGLPRGDPPPTGSAASPAGNVVCARCLSASSRLAGLRACAFHTGPLRKAIHYLKYEDLRALAAPLGRLMVESWHRLGSDAPPVDVIVPVTLHARRERERGYNQSALLARELGRGLSKAVCERALARTRATSPQVGLNVGQRHQNVAGAFRCLSREVSGATVLLVDDVLTTGATLEAAAAALQDGGARSVWGYTLARAE